MLISASAKAWIRNADTETLRAKVEEYAPKATDKPRDVEYRTILLSEVRAELAAREVKDAGI